MIPKRPALALLLALSLALAPALAKQVVEAQGMSMALVVQPRESPLPDKISILAARISFANRSPVTHIDAYVNVTGPDGRLLATELYGHSHGSEFSRATGSAGPENIWSR